MTPRTRKAIEAITNPDVRQTRVVSEEWREPLLAYHHYLVSCGRSQATVKLRLYQLRRLATTIDAPPFAVDTEDLIDFLSNDTWTNETRRSLRSALISFYSWAHTAKRIDTDPSDALTTVPHHRGRPRPAPISVINDALAEANPDTRLMIELAAFAGLRCREIACVHSRDVSQTEDGWILYVQGKGDRERTVPLYDHMAIGITDRPKGYAFPGQIDGHLSPKRVTERISEQLPRPWTAHTLRHSYASRVYEASNSDIRIVQELLGHASVATTQIYTAISLNRMRAAVEQIQPLSAQAARRARA